MAKKSDYSLFINFFFNSLKIGLFIIFRPSLFTIHYFLAHHSLFIIKKCHYSLIIIPHPDPHKTLYQENDLIVNTFICYRMFLYGSTVTLQHIANTIFKGFKNSSTLLISVRQLVSAYVVMVLFL